MRRFLALEAWKESDSEFARILEHHRQRTKPFVAPVPTYTDGQESAQDHVLYPNGFDSRGMAFAIDYSF